jgi:hypothetical protein
VLHTNIAYPTTGPTASPTPPPSTGDPPRLTEEFMSRVGFRPYTLCLRVGSCPYHRCQTVRRRVGLGPAALVSGEYFTYTQASPVRAASVAHCLGNRTAAQ